MPIYEFRCEDCNKKSSFLVRSISHTIDPICPACGNSHLVRTVASFAYHKSLQTVWEESGDPTQTLNSDYYKDPRNIGRWTEKKFQESGMEMPDQIQDMIQAARQGELPESMKDLKSATPDTSYH